MRSRECRFGQVRIGQLFWWHSRLYQRVDRGMDQYGPFNAVRIGWAGLKYALFAGCEWVSAIECNCIRSADVWLGS